MFRVCICMVLLVLVLLLLLHVVIIAASNFVTIALDFVEVQMQ